MKALPDLDLLRTFVTFAEHLSFTRAASVLHLSQPAVHVQVRKLAEVLGVALYERRGRELALTPAGVATLGFAREMIERTERFVSALSGPEADPAVRLSAGEGAFLYLLGPALRDAHRAGVKVELSVRDGLSTIDAVRRGDAHLGVAPLTTGVGGLTTHVLARADAAVAMPRRHRLARKRTVRARDLAGEPLVVPPPGAPLRTAIELVLAAASVELRPAVEVRGWPLTLRFVELGVGIAIVNDVVALPPGVVARRFEGLPAQRYAALRRADAPLPPAGERLWSILTSAPRARR
ncbi:MAG TPA: LysR family transcriptional regulator [Sandaracinaceae bacterium]